MSSAVLKMNAFVRVSVGMRVIYDCPPMSDDYRSDQFFRENRGKIGTIQGFSKKFVGPLDDHGRLPGVYYKTGSIDVQFDGEKVVHREKNLLHFILLDTAETVVPKRGLDHQKAADLPYPIEYWPGDTVHLATDLLKATRLVSDIQFEKNGKIVYVLTEASEARKKREADKEALIAKRQEEAKKSGDPLGGIVFGFGMDIPRNDHCKESDLQLIERGNVYHLYHDPAKLSFTSPKEELSFWSQDGISHTVYGKSTVIPSWEWPLDKARKMVRDGKGDIITTSRWHKNLTVTGRPGDYRVRLLHDCFAKHRTRVRKLTLSISKHPMEREIPFAKAAMMLVGE